jgi:hypothetical protein
MYVYIMSEPRCYTVGFYDPDGEWQPESDYGRPADAAERVRWLNGGTADNARLIAAAPELLDVARRALARILWHLGEGELTGVLAEAISKATGEDVQKIIDEESNL